jgi:tRNA A37 threonylcarbamoyladenosine biosynthesis protein TsaE
METNDTVEKIWLGDHLGRREDAELLIEFLKARVAERSDSQGAYVINLSAGWGAGKTFFLRKMKEQLELTGHLVSYIDAWKDDDAAEPMVAVMAAMNETLKPHLAKRAALAKAWNVATSATGAALALTAKGIGYQLAKKALGPAIEGLENLGADVDDELAEKAFVEGAGDSIASLTNDYMQKRINAYEAHRSATERFKKSVAEVLKVLETKAQKEPPYFILIDELDRCRPTYAVEMLEQVKHLFDVPGLCFVIATDGEQLAHSVSAVYGASFDGAAYLRRFFNRRYRFSEPDILPYVQHLLERAHIPSDRLATLKKAPLDDFIADGFKAYRLSLRDVDQVFDIIRSFITSWSNGLVPIQLGYLIPLVIAFHFGRTDEFDALERGTTNSIPPEWSVNFNKRDINQGWIVANIRVSSAFNNLSEPFNSTLSHLDDKDSAVMDPKTPLGAILTHELQHGSHRSVHSDRFTMMKQYASRVRNLARLDRYEDEEDI